jgi:hypothetical protein
MLAVLNHRASCYHELHHARTKLMGLRERRSGLFIKKRDSAFSCHAVLSLLSEIAAAKFEELRLLLSLDAFEKKLRDESCARKAHRIWLGSIKEERAQEEQPKPRQRRRMDNVTAFLLTSLLIRSLPKPRF